MTRASHPRGWAAWKRALAALRRQLVGDVETRAAVLSSSLLRQEGEIRELREALLRVERDSLARADVLSRDAEASRRRLAQILDIECVTALVRQAPPSQTLVSIVLPTCERAALLTEAVASVRAQSHARWELLVIDAGPHPTAEAALSGGLDPRIRVLREGALSPALARNRGLAASAGSVIAYLDDDNTMGPDWLRAVAWAFDRHPRCALLYGAQVVEDGPSGPDTGPLERQFHLRYEPWDRERLVRGNFIDIGAVAHRSGLTEARFDPLLEPVEDWDLLLRLSEEASPLRLPVHSGVYRVQAAGRMSLRDPGPPMDRIRVRLAAVSTRA